MLDWLRRGLTTDSAQWYETLPFVVGFAFVVIEIFVRMAKKRTPVFSAPALGYMLSEGMAVCVMPMYGLALAFDRALALAIADKNSKVLVVAMLISFATLVSHVIHSWMSPAPNHE